MGRRRIRPRGALSLSRPRSQAPSPSLSAS